MENEEYIMIYMNDAPPQILHVPQVVAEKFVLALENDSEKEIEIDGEMIDPKNVKSVWTQVYNSNK